MRKRMIVREPSEDHPWFDLESVAQVEITSEDPAHPIEGALKGDDGGWVAAASGEQVIRVLFDEPIRLRSIELRFDEHRATRTQEFSLRWSPDRQQSYRDIVRQQYTFSPGTTRETERFSVDLDGVTALELRIVPDIAGGSAVASLARLRLA